MNASDEHSSIREEPIPEEVLSTLEGFSNDERTALKDVWQMAGLAKPEAVESTHVRAATRQFRAALRRQQSTSLRRDRAASSPLKRFTAIRWPVMLGTALFVVWFAWFTLYPVEFIAPKGQIERATLADGTVITLEGGSRLSYRRWLWGKTRNVELAGQAFFDVVPGRRPFTVRTANANLQVVGTSFNVESWRDDSDVYTVLHVRSGVVSFAPIHGASRGDTLRAGQLSRLVGNTGRISEPIDFNPDIALLWLSGGIGFTDQPLNEIISALARRYDVEIEIDLPESQDELITWIQPRLRDLESALTDICEVGGCRFRQADDGYYVERIP